MIMLATILRIRPRQFLVRDLSTRREVIVHTNRVNTRGFRAGDRVSIFYNGVMTQSIPPQITAIRIWNIFSDGCCR